MRALATAAVISETATELGNVAEAAPAVVVPAPAPTRRSRSRTLATPVVSETALVSEERSEPTVPMAAGESAVHEVTAPAGASFGPAATAAANDDAREPKRDSAPEPAHDFSSEASHGSASENADAFEHAARLFAFTGEVPITEVIEKPTSVPTADDPLSDVRGSAPRKARSNFRKIATAGFSVSVMGVIGAFAMSMSMPFMGATTATQPETAAAAAIAPVEESEIQAFVASSEVQNASVERESDYSQVSAAQIADETGIRYSSNVFTNDRTAAIQWPFAVGVDMSYGYGMRDGRLHEGIDFTPGAGAPIQSIADGVVRIATENGGNYGVTVYVDHVIDGEVITSHYSHMQYGSLAVVEGQEVKVGDPIGLTGNTGRSFGAHLHFELIVNGSTIDPMPWLKEHAG